MEATYETDSGVGSTDMNSNSNANAVENLFVIQCKKCHRIVGDSSAEINNCSELEGILLHTVSTDVTISATMHQSEAGFDIYCRFQQLKCKHCNTAIGRIYRTVGSDLLSYLDNYLIFKEQTNLYQFSANQHTKKLAVDDVLMELNKVCNAIDVLTVKVGDVSERMTHVEEFLATKFPLNI